MAAASTDPATSAVVTAPPSGTPAVVTAPASGTPNADDELRKDWNNLSDDDKNSYFKSLPAENQVAFATRLGMFGHASGVQAPPSVGTIPWMKEKAYSILNSGANYLPSAGGVIGGLVGGLAGTAADPAGGEVPGALLGSEFGGMLGDAARQGVQHLTGYDQYEDAAKKAWDSRALSMTHSGEEQFLAELTGIGTGKLIRPTLERSIGKLYYAGKLKYGDPLGPGDLQTVMNDIVNTEKTTGKATTVRDLVNVIKTTKNDIGQKVDNQLMLPINQNGQMVMLGKATADPTPIAKAISDMATADPSIVRDAKLNPAGKEAVYLAHIQKQALDYSRVPPTYEELTSRRIRLNNELAPLYELPTAGEQRVYLLDHPNLAVAKAEADAIRDVVYPKMDALSGQPMGTTAELQAKRGALMSLEQQTTAHLGNIKNMALWKQGAPITEKTNASGYLSSSGKPGGSLHRIQGLIYSPNPERAADTQVRKAFGHGVGPNTRRIIASPFGNDRLGDEILSMPLRYAFAPSQPPQTYTHTAVNPSTGHVIGSNDGKTWVDVQTGQKIQ